MQHETATFCPFVHCRRHVRSIDGKFNLLRMREVMCARSTVVTSTAMEEQLASVVREENACTTIRALILLTVTQGVEGAQAVAGALSSKAEDYVNDVCKPGICDSLC